MFSFPDDHCFSRSSDICFSSSFSRRYLFFTIFFQDNQQYLSTSKTWKQFWKGCFFSCSENMLVQVEHSRDVDGFLSERIGSKLIPKKASRYHCWGEWNTKMSSLYSTDWKNVLPLKKQKIRQKRFFVGSFSWRGLFRKGLSQVIKTIELKRRHKKVFSCGFYDKPLSLKRVTIFNWKKKKRFSKVMVKILNVLEENNDCLEDNLKKVALSRRQS